MNLYSFSVPVFTKALTNLINHLRKAKEHAMMNHLDESELTNARLASDMFPLTRQVQIASDNAKGISARLAGVEPPKMEDNEKTLDELIARCERTLEFLSTLSREKFEGAEEREIPFRYVPGKFLSGHDALVQWYIPNFFFHVTTAYDILRHVGVPLGKADFLGDLPLKDKEDK